ncbi:HK97 gp10 family phage protein [Micromonospora tulbaghiae]|uniref:HK97 gp10 family phage protein n=1 Tax=Micromonospora tulbaghiae TaxID=479978 RepID=UPI003408451C
MWNHAEAARLLDNPAGDVGRDLHRRGRTVERGAKRRCPVSPEGSGSNPPGHLRDSIAASEVQHDALGLYVDVGTDVDYALPVELGSRPHVIESHDDYPLRNPKTGQVFGQRVNHPGTKAQPYLRPALDDIRNE